MKRSVFFLLLTLCSCSVFALDWRMEPDGSRLAFEASYQGEAIPGEFRRFEALLTLDPDRPEQASLSVRVDLASMDLGSSELEEGAASAEWFDTRDYPQAEFRSRVVRRLDPEHYVASGTLRLKGVERDIDVPFLFRVSGSTASMSGALQTQRNWFNIGSGEWNTDELIGFDVDVSFDVKWRRDD